VTLQVSLVVPEGEVWAGPAEMVIAKTRDGDIGVLTGHSPVLGILVEGSLVRILPEGTADG
jgi:F-type H+-transporting ATPase subunit epsilon